MRSFAQWLQVSTFCSFAIFCFRMCCCKFQMLMCISAVWCTVRIIDDSLRQCLGNYSSRISFWWTRGKWSGKILSRWDLAKPRTEVRYVLWFLADRTNGRAYATVLRLSSVCLSSVTLCIVTKRCVLEQKLLLRAYRKSYMRNRLIPKWMTLTFV